MSRGAIIFIAHMHACMHLSLALRMAIKLLLLSHKSQHGVLDYGPLLKVTLEVVFPGRGILGNLA